jgi:hypothetical protein
MLPDRNTDYTIELIQIDDKEHPGKVTFGYRNPTLQKDYTMFKRYPRLIELCD